jgi:riboflavin kinase/FMN adenylyltransferase
VNNLNHSLNSRLTIGSFDGLHIGHQTIIQQLVSNAHQANQSAIVITFFPNPTVYFRKIQNPFYLTTNLEKEGLLRQMGIDQTIILPFNQELAQTSARDFITHIFKRFRFEEIYIGYDFHFGANREGDAGKLEEFGKELGFSVRIQQPISLGNFPVSSSLIRNMVTEGSVENLFPYLQRWYSLLGEVVHGDGRGKKLGMPTANIAFENHKLLPANGIYAARIHINEAVRPAAVSIGVRPTFYPTPRDRTVEAFILDWEQDIYGKLVNLEFVRRLRDEIKYNNAEELTSQVEKDIQLTREIINNE